MKFAVVTLAIVTLAILALLVPARTTASVRPPDIIVVMVDDLGRGPAQRLLKRLPTLKARFVDSGIRFANAYGETPLCCPARAGFLSGLHTHNHGITANHPAGFDQTRTIATALHDAGYWTVLVGKYFNRPEELELPPPGWDVFEIKSGGGGNYRPDWVARTTAEAVSAAPVTQPLFVVMSSSAPHNARGSWLPGPSPVHEGDPACKRIRRWHPPNYDEPDRTDKPAYTQALPPAPFPDGWPLRRHCEALLSVDDGVRWTEDALRERGRLDEAVWLFLSDNGMTYGEHRWPFKLSPYSTPLPVWASWPAGRGTSPRVESRHVSMIDLGRTLAALGGAEMGWADGLDVNALFRDAPMEIDRTELLESLPDGSEEPAMGLPAVPPWWGVRTTDGRWRYVEWDTGERELYDLTADPWELTNVAGDPDYAETEAALAIRLEELRAR